MKKCGKFWQILVWLCACLPTLLQAQQWQIGILAQRGVAHTHSTWQPWIDWLNQQSGSHQFSLITLDLNDLATEQAQNVDFILTNQAQFFYLNETVVRWLVTLKSPRQQHNIAGRIGSAIFVRKDSDIHSLTDLKNRTISAVGEKAFGGFLLGYNELYQQGLIENKDFTLKFTGFPVDNTLLLLQEKKVDAAIVPACIFEELVKEGAIKKENFRLLSAKPNQLGCLASTELLPNWSLAAMPQVPSEVVSELITLLLHQVPNHLPQWTPPYSTTQADQILLSLNKHPKHNLWNSVKYGFQQYQYWIISIVSLLILNYVWIHFQIHRKSKALRQAYQDMRQYEQQLTQADRLSILGEMSAGIAHEINQPLAAIRMYVEGMQYQSKFNDQNKEIFQKILIQIDRCSEIIRNLMSWTRGKNHENTEVVLLFPLLKRAIQFISVAYRHKAEIECDCPPQLSLQIKITVLEQIICNCLLNAIQAQANHILIKVKEQTDRIIIHILDNGTGFHSEELKFPFVPFRTRKPQGLGLGLVLCQRLIHSMQGEISLQNRQTQQGAEVILTLRKTEEEKC